MYPQSVRRGTAGITRGFDKPTVLRGRQRARLLSTLTVITRPVSGSAAMMVTGCPSMADMPSASIAHIAYAVGLPGQLTRIGVRTGENG
jgi:hypothetical protein